MTLNWSEEKKANIRARYAEGWSVPALAKATKVKPYLIAELCQGITPRLSRIDKATYAVRKRHSSTRKTSGTRFATFAHEIET